MRYCPHCRRFNRGRPPICHFCGRTWHVRLCPRGHANPFNAQYCGTCGSADLTETAGPRSIILLMFKGSLWLLAGLSVYLILRGIYDFLRPPMVYQTLSFVIIISLLVFSFQFAMSFMPSPISNGFRRVIGWGMKLIGNVIGWVLKKLWELLRY